MPIIKAKDFVEVYRVKAQFPDLQEMSGRTNRRDLTNFINAEIVRTLEGE